MEILSVYPLVIKNIIIDAYFPSVNPSVIVYQRKKHYRRTIHWQIIFICDSIGNIITDGICVLHRRKNSVGKTVKSCSVESSNYAKPQRIGSDSHARLRRLKFGRDVKILKRSHSPLNYTKYSYKNTKIPLKAKLFFFSFLFWG